jgi:XRE family transcriptional regulator, regulator of sulfur utilization
METDSADRLARNIRQLRQARSLSQQQLAKTAGLPRATWSNLESGAANPTLGVLQRVAQALHVTMEELVAAPHADCAIYRRGSLPSRVQGLAIVHTLLPDPIPGMEIARIELAPQARMTGIPHTPGTREYLTCETGNMVLVVAGERWDLTPGDVVAFRGDQRHSYLNPGRAKAVGYSVVVRAKLA